MKESTRNNSTKNKEKLPLLNQVESLNSSESVNPLIKKESKSLSDFAKYFKDFIINELDIEAEIYNLENLKKCLNAYLEDIMKNKNGLSILLEIRKRNKKINMYKTYLKINNKKSPFEVYVCQWCKNNCLKKIDEESTEINITFTETNTNICCCSIENHDIFRMEKDYNFDDKEINSIIENYSSNQNQIRDKIENLLKDKDKVKQLKIFSYLLNYEFNKKVNILSNLFEYNDNFLKNLLSNLKDYKEKLNLDNIMSFYCKNYLFNNLNQNEQPVYTFNYEYSNNNKLPVLYYGNPNIFNQPFYFQVYRKNIILKNLESEEVFSYLQKLGIDKKFICSHLLNNSDIPTEIFSFGLFSLDLVLEEEEGKKKINTLFKRQLSSSFIIYIFINHICEIFNEYITEGSTNQKKEKKKKNFFIG